MRCQRIGWGLALAALSWSLAAADPAPAPPVAVTASSVVKARWRQLPTGEQMSKANPLAAVRLGLPGEVVLVCVAEATGDVDQCRIAFEGPQGLGFGDAALTIAPVFKMFPATRDGRPEASSVRIPLIFDNRDNTAASADENAWVSGLDTRGWRRGPSAPDERRYWKKAEDLNGVPTYLLRWEYFNLTSVGGGPDEHSDFQRVSIRCQDQTVQVLEQAVFADNNLKSPMSAPGTPPGLTRKAYLGTVDASLYFSVCPWQSAPLPSYPPPPLTASKPLT